MNMKWIVLAWLPWIGSPAVASELYRCVGRAGEVAIQDRACAATQRTSWVRQADRDIRPPEEWRRIREDRDRRNADADRLARSARLGEPERVTRRAGSGVAKRRVREDPCRAATLRRETVLDKPGRTVDFVRRRALNDLVFDACN